MAFISQSARQTLAWLLYLAALLCARSVLAFDAPHIAASQVLQGPDALDHTSFASAANTAGKPEEATAVLASTWGLGTSLLFAELAAFDVELPEALNSLYLYSAAVLVVPGQVAPERPSASSNVPFLTLSDGKHVQQLSSILPVSSINKAAASASSMVGRPLYPFRLEVLELDKAPDQGPWVVYDVPTGTVYLDKRVLDNMMDIPVDMATHVADFANHLFDRVSQSSVATKEGTAGSYLGGLFSSAAAAASLAVASQVPLWFCITCPIVLGMLFPFAFNFGLGAIADELCTYYNLPADACTQLWYSAFALAMILSFASVLPIVTICRLAQCARHASPSPSL